MTATATEVGATDRVPIEFEPSWDAIERPAIRRARAATRALLGFDLGRSVNEGRRMLDRAIAHGAHDIPDAPESLIRLFRESERDPEWLDRERLQTGGHVFRRLGPSAFNFAGATTLLAYTENSIVEPLALTDAGARRSSTVSPMPRAGSCFDASTRTPPGPGYERTAGRGI